MKKIYVRVKPKSPVAVFHRCAMKFEQAWLEVIVDDATAKRLGEEQMLEVSETQPDGFEPTASDASSLQLAAPDPADAVNAADFMASLCRELDACKQMLADAISGKVTAESELLVANSKLSVMDIEFEDMQAEAKRLLEDNHLLTATLKELKAAAPVDQAVAAAVSTRVDEAIAQGDEALEKLKGAVEALAEGAPAEEAKPTKKAGK